MSPMDLIFYTFKVLGLLIHLLNKYYHILDPFWGVQTNPQLIEWTWQADKSKISKI